jgi:hypothetical protein
MFSLSSLLFEVRFCGRKFHPDRIGVHERVCEAAKAKSELISPRRNEPKKQKQVCKISEKKEKRNSLSQRVSSLVNERKWYHISGNVLIPFSPYCMKTFNVKIVDAHIQKVYHFLSLHY